MKPWMANDDIKIIEKAFLDLNKRKIDVLEWGSGGSTVYFRKFLKKHKISYKWLSLEHNDQWFKKVSALIRNDKDVEIKLFEKDLSDPAKINMDEYVTYPRKTGKKV